MLGQQLPHGLQSFVLRGWVPPQHAEHGECREDLRRHRLVGEKHELLDHLIRLAQGVLGDVCGVLRLRVQLELDLLRRQLERPGPHPSRPDELGQLVQIPEPHGELRAIRVVVDFGLGLGVGQRGLRPDNRFAELRVHNLRIRLDLPHDGEGQPVHATPERADVGGEQPRQHVRAPLHEVDGRAALGGLPVDGRVGVDEVRDVRDVNAHAEVAVRQALARHCVVDVFTAWRVDRAEAEVPEVLAAGQVLGARLPICRGQTPQDCIAELAGDDAVLVQDHRALGRAVAHLTQDLGPMTSWIMAEAVPAVEDDHNALVLEVPRMPRLNHDVGQPGVRRDEHAVRLVEGSHVLLAVVVQRLQGATILAPIAPQNSDHPALGSRFRIREALRQLQSALHQSLRARRRLRRIALTGTKLAVGDLATQALVTALGMGLGRGAVELLHHNRVAVDCTVEQQPTLNLDFLGAVGDARVQARVHVHPQSSLEETLLFQAPFHLARLQVRWIHRAVGPSLHVLRLTLPLLAPGRGRGRGTRAAAGGLLEVVLAERQPLATIWKLWTHALRKFPRRESDKPVSYGLRLAGTVVSQQNDLRPDDMPAVPMRNSPDRAVVAVIDRLVGAPLHKGLSKELVREHRKSPSISRRARVEGGAPAADDWHGLTFELRRCPLVVAGVGMHVNAAERPQPGVGAHVPVSNLLQNRVWHDDMVHTRVFCDEVDLMQGDVGVQHNDLVGPLEDLWHDVVAQVHLAHDLPDLVLARAPEPDVQAAGPAGHIVGDVRLLDIGTAHGFDGSLARPRRS
mmetsp:Transcript_96081/g.311748  ORF Transcript_96081/g.311748 Transcript_96081/m.311748 type:complete len:794 (-) Transcript_96081:1-2382(-)